MFDALDISASALHAQKIKMDTIASNIANANTTRAADGTISPYKRKQVVFSTVYNEAMNPPDGTLSSNEVSVNGNVLKTGISYNQNGSANGVKVAGIVEDASPLKKVYDPGHPDADNNGYVSMPNVNIVTEMVDMITASRAYEANVTTIDATKTIFSSALRI
jgi:flagellar basal-body rod protein FlgC